MTRSRKRAISVVTGVLVLCMAVLLLSSCEMFAAMFGATDGEEPELYRVTYSGSDHTGGNVPFDSRQYREGEAVLVRGPGTMVKALDIFNGWEIIGEGNIVTATYAEGDQFAMPAHNVSLHARWIHVPAFAVMYEPNHEVWGETGGTIPGPHATYYQVGATVTVLDNTGGLVGPFIGNVTDGIRQRFVEWSTNSDGSGTSYVGGDTFEMPEHNVWLYANYTNDSNRIGKVGPAGGWVFVYNPTPQPWGSALEAWVADEATVYRWKTANTETVGADGSGFGDGYSNTYSGMIGSEHPAAAIARHVAHGGHSDWYLPALGELQEMLEVLAVPGHAGFTGAQFYWSSTEAADPWASAVLYHLGDLLTESREKTGLERVRVIRRFGPVSVEW